MLYSRTALLKKMRITDLISGFTAMKNIVSSQKQVEIQICVTFKIKIKQNSNKLKSMLDLYITLLVRLFSDNSNSN